MTTAVTDIDPNLLTDEITAHLVAVDEHAAQLAQWTAVATESARDYDGAIVHAAATDGIDLALDVLTKLAARCACAQRVVDHLAAVPVLTPDVASTVNRKIMSAAAQAQSDLSALRVPAYRVAMHKAVTEHSEPPVRLPADVSAVETYDRVRADITAWISANDQLVTDLARLPIKATLTSATALLDRARQLQTEVTTANAATDSADAARAAENL